MIWFYTKHLELRFVCAVFLSFFLDLAIIMQITLFDLGIWIKFLDPDESAN